MQTMVGHPAAGIRNAGFHALEDMLMALQPGNLHTCAAAAAVLLLTSMCKITPHHKLDIAVFIMTVA